MGTGTLYSRLEYNANGGSGAPAATQNAKPYRTYTTGSVTLYDNVIVASGIPIRTGYSFVNWKYTQYDVDRYAVAGNQIQFQYSVSPSGGDHYKTITLYAQWTPQTYTISYNANGGSGAPSSQTKTYGVNLTLSSTVPTRTNYIFQGWSTSYTGTAQYQPGGTFTTNANTVLYAVWKQAAATLDTVSNTEIGGSGTATWTIINSAHTYKLSIGFLNAPVVEVTSAANTSSCSFTIPNTWLSTFANAASATVTATLYTYNGGTLVGSTQKTFTVSVPASVKPTISAFTATPHSANTTAEGWNIAVQGYSYLTLAVTADPGSGSSIASIAFSGHGIKQSSVSATGNTAILTDSGTLIYTVIVTDGRGRSVTTTVNVTCYEYANPTISSLTAVRCYSDGTASDTEGDYIKAFPTFAFSSVNWNNSLSVNKIEYKQQDASTWTVGVQSVTSGQWTTAFGPADVTKSFNVRFTITDALGNTYALEIIVQSVVGYGFGLKNDRFRLGGPVRKPGFECDWDAEFHGVVDILQRRCSATLSSAGWYRVIHYDSPSSSDSLGQQSFIIELYITRGYATTSNETHKITLNASYNTITFTREDSVSNALGIDKIRYIRTSGTGNAYVDIHYNLSVAEVVTVDYSIKIRPDFQQYFTAEGLTSVADSPSGETVVTTYNFGATCIPETRTLLWENWSTADVAAQTIPLDLSQYTYIDVVFDPFSDLTRIAVARGKVGHGNPNYYRMALQFFYLESGTGTAALTAVSRIIDVYYTGVVIAKGQMLYNNTKYEDWNSRARPLQIWGIK